MYNYVLSSFFLVLLDFIELYWDFSGFCRILLGCTEFYWLLHSFTGF